MTQYLIHAMEPLYGQQNVTSLDVLSGVVDAFNLEFHKNLDASRLSDSEREQLREYLGSDGSSLYYKKIVRAHLPLYETAATKIIWLENASCSVCPPGNEVSLKTFPVEVPPWSHQCAPDVGPALRRAIDDSPLYRDHFKDQAAAGPICMRIAFILGENATMKDCDNMAKGLVDAFQGLLYVNDKQVEHLDLIKVHNSPGAASGYILMRRMSTLINDHSDVLVSKHAQILWMTAESLRIDRFLKPPKQ